MTFLKGRVWGEVSLKIRSFPAWSSLTHHWHKGEPAFKLINSVYTLFSLAVCLYEITSSNYSYNKNVTRESSFNMGGGWRYRNLKLEILAAPLASGSIFLGAPPPVGFEVNKHVSPPPSPSLTIFSEPPFRVSKNFRSPPQCLCPLLSY